MTLMTNCRNAIKAGKLPPIFKEADLKEAGVPDKDYNLSNYDKGDKNKTHKKVLVSRKIWCRYLLHF